MRCLILAVGLTCIAGSGPRLTAAPESDLTIGLTFDLDEAPELTLDFDRDDKTWALHVAALEGSTADVRNLLHDGYDPNLRTPINGNTPLHWATKGGAGVVALLLKYGADPDLRGNHNQHTALRMAVRGNKYNVARILLANNANPNIASDDDEVPLHMAAIVGNGRMISMLLEHGASVNAQMFAARDILAGWTPLHFAVKFEHKDAIAALTKHGATWGVKDARGVTPAMIGAGNGMSRDKFILLTRSDAQFSAAAEQAFAAASETNDYSLFLNDVEAVRDVLDAGWDANKGVFQGRTLLHLGPENPRVVQLLVEYGANVNILDDNGATPLLLASVENRTENVKALLDSGADPNIAREDNLTPLIVAARNDNVMMIDMLVEHGADVDAPFVDDADRDRIGWSPLHVAAAIPHRGAIAALTKHGANTDLKDAKGHSPADIAARNGMSRDEFAHLTRSDARRSGNLQEKTIDVAGVPFEVPGVRALLAGSVDFDRDEEKWALHAAAAEGRYDRLHKLLDDSSEWDPNLRSPTNGYTPLHLASAGGDVGAVKRLLDYGADPNLMSYSADEATALYLAISIDRIYHGREHVVWALLEGGADPNLRAGNARPLHYAASGNNPRLVDLLVEFGADVNAVTTAGNEGTPLHIATAKQNERVILALTRHGADWRIRDANGRTPASFMGRSRKPFLKELYDIGIAETVMQDLEEDQVESKINRLGGGAIAIALIVIVLTAVYERKRREWARARATDELLRGEEAAAPKPKPQRTAKKPTKRRDAPRARRRQTPRARESTPEENTPEHVVAAPEPKPEPAPTRAEPPRPAPVAAPTPPRAETPPPKPAPTRAEPPPPAPVAAPPPSRAEMPPPEPTPKRQEPVPESKTEEPESKREEPEALVVPRGYETVAHILEAHGESRLLATFEEQMINDETLPFLEASDLLELGVSPMAILAIVDISSAARGKAKKLDAEDVLHDVATHQSVLEAELAEHRAEIARLRMNRRGEVPDHMCCPILMDVMRDPVMAADGHTYEKVAIEQWFLKARTSPTTNEPLASLQLLPNHAIRSAIAEEMERRRS